MFQKIARMRISKDFLKDAVRADQIGTATGRNLIIMKHRFGKIATHQIIDETIMRRNEFG